MPRFRYVIAIAALAAASVAVPTAGAAEPASVVDQILDAREKTWRWQDVMQRVRTNGPLDREALAAASSARQEWTLTRWTERARTMRRRAVSPPHEAEFRCIHSHEGPWNANTGNGYYGGLQMDLTFQRQYSTRKLRRKGTADRWSPLEQIWVAERALREGRGFYPWPTAARRCGLI
jgi:hypothetical protein